MGYQWHSARSTVWWHIQCLLHVCLLCGTQCGTWLMIILYNFKLIYIPYSAPPLSFSFQVLSFWNIFFFYLILFPFCLIFFPFVLDVFKDHLLHFEPQLSRLCVYCLCQWLWVCEYNALHFHELFHVWRHCGFQRDCNLLKIWCNGLHF